MRWRGEMADHACALILDHETPLHRCECGTEVSGEDNEDIAAMERKRLRNRLQEEQRRLS
jgi:hypothetical protein